MKSKNESERKSCRRAGSSPNGMEISKKVISKQRLIIVLIDYILLFIMLNYDLFTLLNIVILEQCDAI